MSAIPALPNEKSSNLRLALLLGFASLLATLALFPYLHALMQEKLDALPLPLWLIAGMQAAQNGVLCWLLAWLGLFLGRQHGLGAPWLSAWVSRRPLPASVRSHWWLAVALGLLVGLAVTGLDQLWPHPATDTAPIAAWRGLLASFYGGTAEEIQLRLFVVSLLVWLFARIGRRQAATWMFVSAIVLAALLFGAGHLPAAFAAGLAGTPLLIARIVLLNAVVGLVTGGIFWKWGLEHAMLTHFCCDLVLHVLMPLLGMPG